MSVNIKTDPEAWEKLNAVNIANLHRLGVPRGIAVKTPDEIHDVGMVMIQFNIGYSETSYENETAKKQWGDSRYLMFRLGKALSRLTTEELATLNFSAKAVAINAPTLLAAIENELRTRYSQQVNTSVENPSGVQTPDRVDHDST